VLVGAGDPGGRVVVRRGAGTGAGRVANGRRMTRRHLILLATWWLLLGAVNAAWMARDTRPPSWDPCNHLVSELKYRHAVEDLFSGKAGFSASVETILRADDHYPPLAPFAAAVLGLPFAPSPDVETWLLSQLALAILLFSVFRLGSELASPEAGAVAATAATSFLLVAAQSRMFMLDLPDAAMTTLALLLLWRAGDFGRWRSALAFAAALAAALLTKWTCLFFLWLPLCRALGLALRGRWRRLGRLLAALAIAAAIASPWYVAHLWNIARDFGKFGYRVGQREGDPPVLTLKSLFYYAAALPRALGIPWLLLLAAGLAGLAAAALARRPKSLRPSAGLFLSLWIAGGWLALTLIRNKDSRYLLPLLPALAILCAAGLLRLRPKGETAVRVAAAAALASVSLAWLTDAPRRESWPVREAVRFLRGASVGRAAVRMRIVPDLPFFERHAFEYFAEEERFGLDVGTWFGFPGFADFVVTKTGEQGDRPEAMGIMDEIGRPGSDFPLLFKPVWERPLPDGSRATIFAREITPVAGTAAPNFEEAFRSAAAREIARHASQVRGLAIEVETYSDAETLRGRFRRVTVRADSASILPRPNASQGIPARDLRIVATDLTVNPHAVVREGKIRVLSLAELEPHLRLDEAAANRFPAALRARPAVRFAGGLIEAAVNPVRGPSLAISLRPAADAGNVRLRIERCRVGGVPLPAFLLRWLASGNNPVLKPMPFRLRLDSISAERGALSVN
jgi:hypothetical protein